MNHLPAINDYIVNNTKAIDDWISHNYKTVFSTPGLLPIFTSVDIRVSNFKIAHVDANLFPAGFNNLSLSTMQGAKNCLQEYLSRYFPSARNILIIPENFTRNLKYVESLNNLKTIFADSSKEVVLGSPFIEADRIFHEIALEIKVVKRAGNSLELMNGWRPDVIVLNNDLTTGIPAQMINLDQPIIPSPSLGWHSRSKYRHFKAFEEILNVFCLAFKIDPWLLSTINGYCENIDFKNKKGLECLAKATQKVINQVKDKYQEYGIKKEPYIFIKADKGTYGMGIMAIRNPEEIIEINKKNRHSMNNIKSGIHNAQLLIQEGVETIETFNEHPAESLAYMIGGQVIEIFTRWNDNKDKFSNLNTKGMRFTTSTKQIYNLKTLVARLACLAIAFE